MSRQEVIARLRKIEGEEARKSAAGVPGTFRQAHKPNNVKYNTEFYVTRSRVPSGCGASSSSGGA